MDKFGLFDNLIKLATDKNTAETIKNATLGIMNSLNASKKTQSEKTKESDAHVADKSTYSKKAILDAIRRHDELSKMIDEREKNKK